MSVDILHVSDVHFGRDAQLAQLEAIEDFAPELKPDAVVISGDLTQRARHGEFQAAHGFMRRLQQVAPTLVIPGNHDVQWWKSPLHVLGRERLYTKYRRWFGDNLTPVLEVPGAIIAGALSAHGVAPGSLTWNPNDMAVKGHLPKSETERIREVFGSAARRLGSSAAKEGTARVLVLHHNVLPGAISERMGLAHWQDAQRRLRETGADVVLCGHDHQEGAGVAVQGLPVSTAGTHTNRTRGGRASVFNLVRIHPDAVEIQHFRWDSGKFVASDQHRFARLEPVIAS